MLFGILATKSLRILPIIIWCLGFVTDLIALEGEAFHEAPQADEYGCGPDDLVVVPMDREPDQGVE